MSGRERKRDDESGRYVEKYPKEDIIEAIRERAGRAATSEIAEAIDSTGGTAYDKLSALEEQGELTSRKAGGIRIWSVAENED